MNSRDPIAGAASPAWEDGPRVSTCLDTRFDASPIPGLISGSIPGASARPAGVALRLADNATASAEFELVLTDDSGAPLLGLGHHSDEDVVAVWRALGGSSGLPLVIEDPDGVLHQPYPQIGRLQVGECRMRRRHAVLSGRRPRFLTRRKTGRLPVRPAIYREREIIPGGTG